MSAAEVRRFELADLTQILAVDCPCGSARRAFAEIEDFPATIHLTEISADARVHYHKRLTETYYFLDCAAGAHAARRRARSRSPGDVHRHPPRLPAPGRGNDDGTDREHAEIRSGRRVVRLSAGSPPGPVTSG